MSVSVGVSGTAVRRPAFGSALVTLAIFELRFQRRDFLAWLSALVFLLLCAGFTGSGVITLVRDLGELPRTAPWAIAQAVAGVTAFGQVITAMTAATTVLRDVGLRTQGLMLTTALPWRWYLAGRFAGTLLTLACIYSMIPLGLWLGDLLGANTLELAALWPPIAWLLLPNVLVVAALFFAAGALSGGFLVILFVGLGLVACWQTGIGLVQGGVAWGAMLDPFGNAAMLAAVADATLPPTAMPVTGTLVMNRLLWMSGGALTLGWTLWRWRPVLPGGAAVVSGTGARTQSPATTSATMPTRPLRGAGLVAQLRTEFRFGWRWVTRERGLGVLLLLAVLNALANGWTVADDPSALVRALEFHARLFAILIATIYAGELVWRDRDVRAQELMDALPSAAGLRLAGRSAGVALALLALPAVLALSAVLLPALRGATPDAWCSLRWLLGVSAPQFLLLFGVSLLVHRVINHKTVAHLSLIALWVLAIALGFGQLAEPWAQWGSCG